MGRILPPSDNAQVQPIPPWPLPGVNPAARHSGFISNANDGVESASADTMMAIFNIAPPRSRTAQPLRVLGGEPPSNNPFSLSILNDLPTFGAHPKCPDGRHRDGMTKYAVMLV
ncbi:hypothetical protein [Methylocapsa sp. S129]|uniref:hypothetical protein n=1 Tax=Methylocapsa sp. S129 TaxID=1641869 RepID=UPI00131BA76D|nr:hypothetical protein [Methylocapsa sp. S129]